jgi:hypothetical protein
VHDTQAKDGILDAICRCNADGLLSRENFTMMQVRRHISTNDKSYITESAVHSHVYKISCFERPNV